MTIFAKLTAVLALLVGLFFAEQYVEGRGYARARAEDMAAVNAQKAEAAQMLAAETAKTLANATRLSDLIAKHAAF